MSMMKCPGQQSRFWKPDDVFETTCPHCKATVEFFKDDQRRNCPSCGKLCMNPKLSLGCLAWCQHADKCRPMFENNEGESK